jgi:hypothetical protein
MANTARSTVAMAVIHVGMSPQAGGRCHGLPKNTIPIRNPTTAAMMIKPQTRPVLSSGFGFSRSSFTARNTTGDC